MYDLIKIIAIIGLNSKRQQVLLLLEFCTELSMLKVTILTSKTFTANKRVTDKTVYELIWAYI